MLKIDAVNIILTVINLLILFVAVKLLFFKPIAKIIQQRQDEADKQLEDARKKQEEADALKTQYDESVAGLEEKRAQTMKEARDNADAEYQKILDEAKKEAKEIRITAENEAEREKAKIIKSAEKEIADMVVDAATKVVGAQSGVKIDSSLYDEFLSKAGK